MIFCLYLQHRLPLSLTVTGTRFYLPRYLCAVIKLSLKGITMANNSGGGGKGIYFIVGALVVAVLGMGYFMIQNQTDEPDLAIEFSEDGIKVDGN